MHEGFGHVMLRIDRRLWIWKATNFLICILYRVQVLLDSIDCNGKIRNYVGKLMSKKVGDRISDKNGKIFIFIYLAFFIFRERIVKHYADLSEQATLKEERAIWHIRRSRLDAVRMEFLLEDEKKWKAEMEEWKKNSKLVSI